MNMAGRHFSWLFMPFCGLVVLGGVLAASFGFGVAPWLIIMGAFCIVMMGSMLVMMVGMGSHTMQRHWSAPWERFLNNETPIEILDRRFAEGAITPEDYRTRRQALANGAAESNGAHKDESQSAGQLTRGRN
jgi:uncharacterized membrane protein